MINLWEVVSENSFAVFVLYLVLSSNFLAPLFPCRLQEFLSESMFVRHILGYLTLTFFVVLSSKTVPLSFAQIMALSAVFYFWFLMTTKMHMTPWFIMITLVGVIYIINLYQTIEPEKVQSEEEQKALSITKQVLAGLAIAVTLIGFLAYFGEKRIEYYGEFSIQKFLLGAPHCKGESPNVGYLKALRSAVRVTKPATKPL